MHRNVSNRSPGLKSWVGFLFSVPLSEAHLSLSTCFKWVIFNLSTFFSESLEENQLHDERCTAFQLPQSELIVSLRSHQEICSSICQRSDKSSETLSSKSEPAHHHRSLCSRLQLMRTKWSPNGVFYWRIRENKPMIQIMKIILVFVHWRLIWSPFFSNRLGREFSWSIVGNVWERLERERTRILVNRLREVEKTRSRNKLTSHFCSASLSFLGKPTTQVSEDRIVRTLPQSSSDSLVNWTSYLGKRKNTLHAMPFVTLERYQRCW